MYYDRYILIENVNKTVSCTTSTIICANFGKNKCGYACSLSTIGNEKKSHDHTCKQLTENDMNDYIQSYIIKYNLLDDTPFGNVASSSSSSSSSTTKKRRKVSITKSDGIDEQSTTITNKVIDHETHITTETISSSYTDSSSSSSFILKAISTEPSMLLGELDEKIKLAKRSIARVS